MLLDKLEPEDRERVLSVEGQAVIVETCVHFEKKDLLPRLDVEAAEATGEGLKALNWMRIDKSYSAYIVIENDADDVSLVGVVAYNNLALPGLRESFEELKASAEQMPRGAVPFAGNVRPRA